MNFTHEESFRVMNDSIRRMSRLRGHPDWTPAADIIERDNEYLVKVHMPDVSKDEVKVVVDNGVLTICGERRSIEAPEHDPELHAASVGPAFSHSFSLPESCDVSGIRAELRDGVLRVRVPKGGNASSPQGDIEVT